MKKAIGFLLVSGLVLPALSQKIFFENYTIQNGLPQNIVNGICQDADGYIWFATQVGVARYDGYTFSYFNVSNGLPDNYVNCILAARNGYVWLGTEGGIARYNGREFSVITETDGLVNNHVDRLEEDGEGNVWAASAYGLSVITPDTVLSYTKGHGLLDNSVMDLLVDSQGRVHVSTFPFPGVSVFSDPFHSEILNTDAIVRDMLETREGEIWYATQEIGILVPQPAEGTFRHLGYAEGLRDEIVLSLMEDHQGRIWCGTYAGGIFRYEKGSFTNIRTTSGKDPVAMQIHEDSKQRIWFVDFQEGVWLLDRTGFRNFNVSNNLVHDVVTDLTEDRYGNIWLSTLGGASKYGRALFEIYDTDVALPENNVISTYLDSHKRLWIGTYGHLLYKTENGFFELGEHRGFTSDTNPLSFAEDRLGNIYIGTDRGLMYYNGRSVMPRDYWGEDTRNIQFFSLLYTEEGELWCGTDSGLYVLKGSRILHHFGSDVLTGLQVNALDRVGDKVYCGTEEGVSVFSLGGNSLARLTTHDSLSSNVCNDLTHDFRGNVWVATDRGLSMISSLQPPQVTRYDLAEGLTSNAIYFLEFNDSTSLWMGTERGLYHYSLVSSEMTYYGMEDGFYPLDTYRGAVAGGGSRDLWMGTVAGLVHYVPDYNIKDPVAPDLILFPPLVEGRPFEIGEEGNAQTPVFPFNRNSLVFRFTGIHMTNPAKNRFSFMLEGYDDDWSEPNSERQVSYRKIPNGHYVFKVKAYNLDGAVTEREASFAFTIKPPFWKTVWFIILEVLTGLGLVYGTIKYRERQLIREKRILETRVKERTREIEAQKVEIEAQRDEITEQKNFVEEQRDQIAQQNKEITDSIHYAKHIQHAVLPGKIALEKSLPEHFILFKPRDIVSGDFYWMEQKHDRIFVCAADCTGHGVPGAFMSLLGLTFLNEIVNKDEILKASEILNRLRSYIINAMSHKDQQARDGMDVSLVVIDRQLNILEYAGAYNPLVIIRDGELLEFKADKMPIGKHEGEERSFANHKIQVREGDMIYLFSDGFPDQFGGEKGGKYKALPFKRFLLKISAESMFRQEGLLEGELKTWMGTHEQVDDILVMGIRYKQETIT